MHHTYKYKLRAIKYSKTHTYEKTAEKFGVSTTTIFSWINKNRFHNIKYKINERYLLRMEWKKFSTGELKTILIFYNSLKKNIRIVNKNEF